MAMHSVNDNSLGRSVASGEHRYENRNLGGVCRLGPNLNLIYSILPPSVWPGGVSLQIIFVFNCRIFVPTFVVQYRNLIHGYCFRQFFCCCDQKT